MFCVPSCLVKVVEQMQRRAGIALTIAPDCRGHHQCRREHLRIFHCKAGCTITTHGNAADDAAFLAGQRVVSFVDKRNQIMDDGRFHGKAGSIVIKGVVTINEHCNALGQFPASDQIVEDIRCGETLDHIELMAAYAVHQVNDRIGLCLVVFIVAGRQINRIVAVLLQCLGVPEQRFAGARIGSLGRFLLFEQEIQAVGILLRCSGTGGAHIKCHHAKTSSTRFQKSFTREFGSHKKFLL